MRKTGGMKFGTALGGPWWISWAEGTAESESFSTVFSSETRCLSRVGGYKKKHRGALPCCEGLGVKITVTDLRLRFPPVIGTVRDLTCGSKPRGYDLWEKEWWVGAKDSTSGWIPLKCRQSYFLRFKRKE